VIAYYFDYSDPILLLIGEENSKILGKINYPLFYFPPLLMRRGIG